LSSVRLEFADSRRGIGRFVRGRRSALAVGGIGGPTRVLEFGSH
jgi:hypothetical protein